MGRPRSAKSDLHHGLVHPGRRGQDTRADVGDVGHLEEALDGAVLAVGPVEDGEIDVGPDPPRQGGGALPREGRRTTARSGASSGGRRGEATRRHAARFVDEDRSDGVAVFVDVLVDGGGRSQGDLVLGRPAAEKQGDLDFWRFNGFRRRLF